MARRIGSVPSPVRANKRRRHSVDTLSHASSRRRQQSRLSLPPAPAPRADSESGSDASDSPDERHTRPRTNVTPSIAPRLAPSSASSGPKSAASSTSSGRWRRHTPQSLDTITNALDVLPPLRTSDTESGLQPESEPASAEDTGRQLHFDEEETDSDASEDEGEAVQSTAATAATDG